MNILEWANPFLSRFQHKQVLMTDFPAMTRIISSFIVPFHSLPSPLDAADCRVTESPSDTKDNFQMHILIWEYLLLLVLINIKYINIYSACIQEIYKHIYVYIHTDG